MAVPNVLQKGIEIGNHPVHKGRDYGTVTFAAPVVINEQRGNMAVVVRQEGANYYKVHRLVMPDGKQFDFNNQKDTAETAGGVDNNSGLSPTGNVFDNIISDSEKNTTTPEQFSDRNADKYGEDVLQYADRDVDYDAVYAFANDAVTNSGQTKEKYNQKKITNVPTEVADAIFKATNGRMNVNGKHFAFEGGKLYHEIKNHSDEDIEKSRGQKAYTEKRH